MVKVRSGNDETVHYFITERRVGRVQSPNGDLFGIERTPTEFERKKDGPTRRGKSFRSASRSKPSPIARQAEQEGPGVDHYAAQDKPLFELIEGEGDARTSRRCSRSRNPFRRESRRQEGHPDVSLQGSGRNGCEGTF
jgi:DNA gyrase subunit B